jgi:drug/metabolite transporter (DMT)-like permease
MLVAVGVFALMDALMKRLAGHYPPLQVASMRGASSLPFVLAPIILANEWRDLRPVRIWLHLLRGVMSIVMLGAIIFALSRATMADAYAMFMSAPLIVCVVAAVLIGERVGMHRWIAILTGFAGAVVLLKPSSAGIVSVAGAAALVAALAYAVNVVTVRVLAGTETTRAMVFWFLVAMALGAGALAAPAWVPIRGEDWKWIVAIGLTGWIGQHCITEAFRLAPASLLAPLEYTALLWAILIDWVAWEALPSARMLTGSSIIVVAGFLLLYVERRLTPRD